MVKTFSIGDGIAPLLSEEVPELSGLLPFDKERWTTVNVQRFFPGLKSIFDQAPILNEFSFEYWYNMGTNCYMYILGDRSLLIPRLTLRANIGALSGTQLIEDYRNIFDVLEQDGLEFTGHELHLEVGFRPTALFICRRQAHRQQAFFHWLRLDKIIDLQSDKVQYAWTQKFANELPSKVVFMNGLLINDPSRISLKFDNPRIVIPNPNSQKFEDEYNFVGYFNVPLGLVIKRKALDQCTQQIRQDYPPYYMAEWTSHLERSGVLKSGQIVVPQYG